MERGYMSLLLNLIPLPTLHRLVGIILKASKEGSFADEGPQLPEFCGQW
jgi:hypothetical protein